MNNLPLKKINDEVFLATDEIVRLDYRAVEFIKEKAASNLRGRARICAHKDAQDRLHEMVIAIRSDSYIRPHRHHNKVESFHLIEGCADIAILSDEGTILDVVKLSKDHCFYYRLDTSHYHTLIIHSPILVIHEITNGPFDVSAADFALFSPADHDKTKSDEYMLALKNKVIAYGVSG
jgi:cupin fold WbuC family metalloprotein